MMLAQERTVKGVVMQMGAHEVYDVVSNMKQLVETEPDKAKQMFVSHPQVRTLCIVHGNINTAARKYAN